MASHGNNLFPHRGKEVGHPSVGSMDVFGVNIAAEGVVNVVVDDIDEEIRCVSVQLEWRVRLEQP